MTTSRPLPPPALSPAAGTNAVLLLVAAIGIIVQKALGVPGYPTVPPGAVILAVAAGLMLLSSRPRYGWTTVVAVVAPAFVLAGGIVEGSAYTRLGRPGDLGFFIGTALQEIGIVGGVIFGALAAIQVYKKSTAH
jgi:hypothetical protein